MLKHDIEAVAAVFRLSGHCSVVWLSRALKQNEHTILHFALPAKHELYNMGFDLDHYRSFIWAACLKCALSYCTHAKSLYCMVSTLMITFLSAS